MAGIADMLVQSALQSSTQAPDISGAMVKGAQLGEHIAAVQKQRQDIEAAKAKAEQDKFEKVGSWLDTYSKMPEGPAKKAFGSNYIPTGIGALGLNEKIHPDVIKMATSDPNAASFLVSNVRGGDLSVADLNDPEKFAQLYSRFGQRFGDEQKFRETITDNKEALLKAEGDAMASEEKDSRAQTIAGATTSRAREARSEAGQVELSKKTAADYSSFSSGGGAAAAEEKLKKLDVAIAKLKSGKVRTGTVSKLIPGLGSDKGQAVIDPEFKALADDVRGAISLKGQLDSQFSAKEAEIQFNRAIDGALPNKQNIEKLESMRNQLRNDLKNKTEEFKSQGFIKQSAKAPGGNAKLKELSAKAADFSRVVPADQPRVLEALAKKYDVTVDEVKKALGVK